MCVQLYFSANLSFTEFTVQMPKKSITSECSNLNIYSYVCVMKKCEEKRWRVRCKLQSVKILSAHNSFWIGAFLFQNQELASYMIGCRKVEAGVADRFCSCNYLCSTSSFSSKHWKYVVCLYSAKCQYMWNIYVVMSNILLDWEYHHREEKLVSKSFGG